MDFIHCHHCDATFPDDLTQCPHCLKDPEPRSIWKLLFLAIGFAGVMWMLLLSIFR